MISMEKFLNTHGGLHHAYRPFIILSLSLLYISRTKGQDAPLKKKFLPRWNMKEMSHKHDVVRETFRRA